MTKIVVLSNKALSAKAQATATADLQSKLGNMPVEFKNDGFISNTVAVMATRKDSGEIVDAGELELKVSIPMFAYEQGGSTRQHSAHGTIAIKEDNVGEENWKLLLHHAQACETQNKNSNSRAYYRVLVDSGLIICVLGETEDTTVQNRPCKRTPISSIKLVGVEFKSSIPQSVKAENIEANLDDLYLLFDGEPDAQPQPMPGMAAAIGTSPDDIAF